MDPLEDDAALPAFSSSRSFFTFAAIVITLQILVSVILYPFLPDQVPSHWNAAGQITSYMPKLFSAILYPAINLLIAILVRRLILIGPRLGRGNLRANLKYIEYILAAVLVFMLAIQLLTFEVALNWPVDFPFTLNLLLSLLFIFIGNFLGKVRRNFWAGIRTPWTLVSDTVWERTHRLGSWLFFAVGLLGLITSFFAALRLWVILEGVMVITVVLFVYSYLVYRGLEAGGKENSLPPV
jgi:uncharacterized membrane protein